jgi:hypothetical protein
MNLGNLLHNLLAAYAAGVCGSCPEERCTH